MPKNVTKNPKQCTVCKKEYLPRSNRQRYCTSCRKEVDRKRDRERYKRSYIRKGYNQKGKNNNNWKGGTQPYYQRIAFEAYGRVCNRCDSKENILVHHIDRNRKNNKLSNLEVLCKRCHQHEHECWNNLGKYLGNKNMKRDKLGRFKKHL